jgi:dihydropteroate synthase
MMKKKPVTTKCGKTEFHWGERTYIMGILNMSPESFSKDGLVSKEAAIEQAQRMVSEGADILDIGGESTKPGYTPITDEDELNRVIPVIEKMVRIVPVPISIDTTKYKVARRALEAGATILNDQWGLKTDPRLGALAVEYNVPIVLMSNQREISSYDAGIQRDSSSYNDVISEVIKSLQLSIEIATNLGVSLNNIILDPGIGFGKTWQQDIEIVRRLRELEPLGNPILLGPSRKSLIKMVLQTPANDRLEGTAAVVAIGIANGADIVRVHDVKQIARVCKMSDAIIRGI